jgi:hypothetical protein
VPSVLIVSGRSKGRRSYTFPPLKWQGWHLDSRIGRICVAKSTFVDTFAEAVVSVAKESAVVAVTESVFGVLAGEPVVAGFRVIELDGAVALGCVRTHAWKARVRTITTSTPIRMM